MEEIRDRKLNIVGERYRSFSEFYRENEHRLPNALYEEEDDNVCKQLFEVADGTYFSSEDTKDALLFGSDLFDAEFEKAKLSAWKTLKDKYEWLENERFASDTHGQHVLVERHVLGHPESFSRRRENLAKKRSIRVFYDAMCPASTPVKARIRAGVSVLAAIDALEQIGYEVSFSFVLAKYGGPNKEGDPTLLLDIVLKSFGEPLNMHRVEFAMASKSMLFHVGSWWTRRFARTPINYGKGEGYPLSYDGNRLAAAREYAKKQRGVYLSEDIIEIQHGSNPVSVLEYVLRDVGEERNLIAHLRGGMPMPAGVQPAQGKLFSGWSFEEGFARENAEKYAPETQSEEHEEELKPERNDQDSINGDNPNKMQGRSFDQNRNYSRHTESGTINSTGFGTKTDTENDTFSSEETRESGESSSSNMSSTMQNRDNESAEGEKPSNDSNKNSNGNHGDDAGDEKGDGGKTGQGASDEKTEKEDGASKDEESDDESGENMDSEVSAKPDINEEGDGIDFTQISKELEDELQDAEASDPQDVDAFVVMLRKRYVMFEQGEYLRMKTDEKMQRQRAEEHADAARNTAPTPPPPAASVAPTRDGMKLGPPRNTPFSMTYIPEKEK